MIGKRGTADDLDFVFDMAPEPETFRAGGPLKALEGLAEAALTRRG